MTVRIENNNAAIAATMAAAMRSDDPEVQAEAWAQFHQSLTERIMSDFDDVKQSNDSTILTQRGYRQLTSAETQWYQKLADVLRSANPKQAFVEIIGQDIESELMPETIIEDVYRNLEEQHPLLQIGRASCRERV